MSLSISTVHFDESVCKQAIDNVNEMLKLCYDWPGGATSLNNHLWERFMIPLAASAAKHVTKKDYGKALGLLLSILLFIWQHGDYWVKGQEISFMDKKRFLSFFRNLNSAWKTIFQQTEEDLKMVPGKNAKELLITEIKRMQRTLNECTDEIEGKALVTIFTAREIEQLPPDTDEEEGGYEEDYEEDDNEYASDKV